MAKMSAVVRQFQKKLEKETGKKFWRMTIKQELTQATNHDNWMELKEALIIKIHAVV